MYKPKNRKQRRLTRILAAPLLAMIFMLGWTLTYLTEPRTRHQQQPTSKLQPTNETVEFEVIPKEQQTITC